jgi:hypothetical protein
MFHLRFAFMEICEHSLSLCSSFENVCFVVVSPFFMLSTEVLGLYSDELFLDQDSGIVQ